MTDFPERHCDPKPASKTNRHGHKIPERAWTKKKISLSSLKKKPRWLKSHATFGPDYIRVKKAMADCGLHTVCEEANCPNIRECFSAGTATFLILGNVCTRGCRFCDVIKGKPVGLDLEEPRRLAESVARLNLKQVVVTSVTRDDLADGGAALFAETIHQLRLHDPEVKVEVLIPDFLGNREAVQTVLDAAPDVLNHNIETIPRLYERVRPKARYEWSLEILRMAAESPQAGHAKSGIMVGLGETTEEIHQTMQDIEKTGCSILTIGQYLAPSGWHLPIERYYAPDEFVALAEYGKEIGFDHVEAGPLVRSSYKAFDQLNSAERDNKASGQEEQA